MLRGKLLRIGVKVSSHLGEVVRRTVEETLNEMLDKEAQELRNI
jgi:hypothetical protein